MATAVMGIDVGSRLIKLVVARRQRGRWQLQACLAREQGADPVSSLEQMLALLPARLRRLSVAVAIPASALHVRVLNLSPLLDDAQIELAVAMELEQELGAPLEQLCLDYCALPDEPGQVLVLGCRQATLQRYTGVVEAAGLRLALAGVDALLIAETMTKQEQVGPGPRLFVDAGGGAIRLHVLRAGLLVYSRSHALAGGDAAACLLTLRQAIQQYSLSEMMSRPVAVYLYGGLATLPAVQAVLKQTFAERLHLLEPWPAVSCSDSDTGLAPCAFVLASALARAAARNRERLCH